MEQIFLERHRNINSINKENKLNVNLTQKVRLLPYNSVSDTLNLNELFNAERDACDKYRLIFTVNPICSNVLHNMKTEIVYREGSPDCRVLTEYGEPLNKAFLSPLISNTKTPIDYRQAIRDTEYSHERLGELVYHCGTDIFNNHMLRNNGFTHIAKLNRATTAECGTVYNTIFDYQRNFDGSMVKESLPRSTNERETKIHQYQVDNLLTFEEAYARHMKEKDGWFGFNNPTFIDIPNTIDGSVSVNKLLNNNKACEFIDMYPDRSLFSFVPKVNKYRKRTERNWDYCITYPYKSDYDTFNEVMDCDTKNAISADIIHGRTANGHELVVFRCAIKHNLKYGDAVRLFQGNRTQDIFISGIGDEAGEDEEHCFKIYKGDLTSVNPDVSRMFVKKLSNGSGCEYYFRKFKKLRNADESELDSTIAKLAYGENIYGDRIAEIIFTDDIDLTGLKDNRGKKLSEVYLTVVKANRGHKLWYEENVYNDASIEFSHCFGEVSSGIETSYNKKDYNIRKIHGIKEPDVYASFDYPEYNVKKYDMATLKNLLGVSITDPPKTLEDDIIVEKFEEFFGDIVELDPSTNSETVLEKVYHRFNTAQRESWNMRYFDLHNDVLVKDDYDVGTKFNDVEESEGFRVYTDFNKEWVNDAEIDSEPGNSHPETYINHVMDGNTAQIFPGNLQPEGYFYQPHYRIKLREQDRKVQSQVGALIENPTLINSYVTTIGSTQTPFVEVEVTVDYGYIIGDLFGLYNRNTAELIWGVLDSFTPNSEAGTVLSYKLKIELSKPIENYDFENWDLVLTDGSVPLYASYIEKEQRFVWRDILAPSEVDSDNPLSELMFTNGANYIHTNINFFLKRQDPFAKYGLLEPVAPVNGLVNPLKKYKKFGVVIDITRLIYLTTEIGNACL